MGTNIEDFLQPDGKQVGIELNKVRMHQEKMKGHIRLEDPKLLVKRIGAIKEAPPTRPINVVLWEDNSMFPANCSLFSLRKPSCMDLYSIRGL